MAIDPSANETLEEHLEYESDEDEYGLGWQEAEGQSISEQRYEGILEVNVDEGDEKVNDIEEMEKKYEMQFEEEFKKDFGGEDELSEEVEEGIFHEGENEIDGVEDNIGDFDDFSEPEYIEELSAPEILQEKTDYDKGNYVDDEENDGVSGEDDDDDDDDKLIEYNSETEATNVTDLDKKSIAMVTSEYDEFDERNFDNEEISGKIPVYLDFCDLMSDGDKSLANVWLNEEIKVDFDFMKLYPPNCKEDELYLEFDSLFDRFEDCINLTFSEIFGKIKQKITNPDINIHLTFGDLLNFTIESDSIFCQSLKLKDLLKSYEMLKSQSPNADLYGFLSVRVWCTRKVINQFEILSNAVKHGFRIENLKEIITNKRIYEDEINVEGNSSKRRKGI